MWKNMNIPDQVLDKNILHFRKSEEKVKNSDYVIDNSNSKEETIEIVKKVLKLLNLNIPQIH